MRKHKKFLIKMIILPAIILQSVILVNKILVPKYYYDNIWPTTSTFIDFYKLEKNTVDVLFLGSSHGVSSFSPQKLYNDYSIRSYNLSSEQQNLLVSYYWLKEALRYQTPKVVVLDTYILYPYRKKEILNSDEATIRKAFDFMRWSKNKVEAVNDVAALDEKQSKVSYYFTNIRFHTRWKGLNEDDFTFSEMEAHGGLKGFSALSDYCMIENYLPFKKGVSEETEEMVPLMQEYLNHIVSLCREHEIKLIIVKTPCTFANIARYNSLMDYAEKNEIQYIDFNEEEIYQECGFDFPKDTREGEHLNIWGAEKVTDYIGRYLEEHCKIEKKADVQWDVSDSYYADIKKDCNLTKITDLNEYLHMIKDERYTVFISIKDEGVDSLDNEIKNNLAALGLTANFDKEGAFGKSYYAIIENEKIIEKMLNEEIETAGTLRKGRILYKISSAGYKVGNKSSINIAGKEYSKNGRGLNIVVYNNDLKKVVDSVVFDTHDTALTATR